MPAHPTNFVRYRVTSPERLPLLLGTFTPSFERAQEAFERETKLGHKVTLEGCRTAFAEVPNPKWDIIRDS